MSTDPKNQELVPEINTQEVSRRTILKTLVAGGGVAATSLLPEKWSKPLVGVGALPVHAQTSGPVEPLYRLDYIEIGPVEQPEQKAQYYATEILYTRAGISPAAANIELRVTVTATEPGHPLENQVVFSGTRLTDASGMSADFVFDLGGISPLLTPGLSRARVEWTFVNPSDGTGSIFMDVDIEESAYTLVEMYAWNPRESEIFYPDDRVETGALISPAAAGIALNCTFTVNEPGHPSDGQVQAIFSSTTDSFGEALAPIFDLNTISPLLSPGVDRLLIEWSFQNPSDGTNTVFEYIDIEALPPS